MYIKTDALKFMTSSNFATHALFRLMFSVARCTLFFQITIGRNKMTVIV